MDALTLARVQFALTVGFHYIFPPLSIGLGLILVITEASYLKTGRQAYRELTRFWARIFGLIFAMGVATGIVMEFQFGTNWASYSRFVGDVFGSALAAEGVFAFFLESGFLAVLLFGWDRVSPRMHFFATVMVFLGSVFSAIWIVVANSWMQTPAGYRIVESAGSLRAEITSFAEVVFNPSSLDRLGHVLVGALQAGAFLVMSVSAYYLLKKRHEEHARFSLKVGLMVAAAASLLQLVSGHASAMGISKTQPAKLAAFEGHFEASAPAALYLFGWVDEQQQRVRASVGVPGLLSLLVTGDSGQPITGLNAFAPEDRPPVNPVFQSYHLMVGIGLALILLSLAGLFSWLRGTLFENRRLLWLYVFAVVLPQAANQLGWFSAEVGRQPWIVYGLMRTQEGISRVVSAAQTLGSLTLFVLIYALLFALFLYLLDHKIRQGPVEESAELSLKGPRA